MKHKCNCGMDLDIDLAAHVQQLLFPKSSPLCNWCCIGNENRMASGLGGDYFDFITMPDQCQAIFIGDVTGHGLHASVVMSLLYGFIHRAARESCSALELVEQANDFLQTFATRSREFDHYFSSSLFFGIIDPETLEMEYVNAGHPMPMVRREGEILSLPPTGSLIGFFNDPKIGMRNFRFQGEDRLLLFTDGIVDAPRPDGLRFGLDRLKDVLLNKNHDHLHFLDELFLTLGEFGASDPPVDDCTAIVVDFHGPFPA
jgi:sigma-B regulation protein RsbU (phosphoserine phosphatase)